MATRDTSLKAKPVFWGEPLPVFAEDPDTANWGQQQASIRWFNSTSGTIKYWDGSAIKTITAT